MSKAIDTGLLGLLLACGPGPEPPCGNCDLTSTTTSTTTSTSNYTTPNGSAYVDKLYPPGCDSQGFWHFRVDVIYWTNDTSIVNAWDSADPVPWNEEHVLVPRDWDLAGANETMYTALTPGVDPGAQVANENTVFQCGIHDAQPVMTYAVRIHDLSGNFSDCAVFATDPTGVDRLMSGETLGPNLVSDEHQLTLDNCTIWEL